jgi:hypothetical protein
MGVSERPEKRASAVEYAMQLGGWPARDRCLVERYVDEIVACGPGASREWIGWQADWCMRRAMEGPR